MKPPRFPGLVFLAACLAGGLSGQDAAGAPAGTEFDQVVAMLKTFDQESRSGFVNLQGELLKFPYGQRWLSKVGYPPVVKSLTRVHAPGPPSPGRYIDIKIQEPDQQSAERRVKLLQDAFRVALPAWSESEPALLQDDRDADDDLGVRTLRNLRFSPVYDANARSNPSALLKYWEDLEQHTFTTSLSFFE